MAYTSIRPGESWNDSEGNRIEAHGGTMFMENGTFYWVGEDKSRTTKEGRIWTWGVNLYSSVDLYNWKKEAQIIAPMPGNPKSIFFPERRLDRPHIIKCDGTGKYVLWLKFSGEDADYAILTSGKITGPYELVREHFRPYGHKCGDYDLVKDEETGEAFLYFEADHTQVLVSRLNASYTDTAGSPAVIYENLRPPLMREAPACFQRNGLHYLITSGMSGYVPNPSETAVSEKQMGPYEVQGNPCENDESSATFNSQISCIFKLPGKKDVYIAMADRRVPECVMTSEKYDIMQRAIRSHFDSSVSVADEEVMMIRNLPMLGSADTSKAVYVWLPVSFEGDRAVIRWKDEWRIE